jgi:Domain of unknown function (DUF4375)
VFDEMVTRAGAPDDEKHSAFEELSEAERAVYVLRAAADQVTRGGFEQLYFFLPHLAGETEAAAELVKARAFRRLFERANAVAFADGPRKRSQSEFRRMMKALQRGDAADVLAPLDDEFDGLMRDPATSLDGYLAVFIETRPFEFRSAGAVRDPESG